MVEAKNALMRRTRICASRTATAAVGPKRAPDRERPLPRLTTDAPGDRTEGLGASELHGGDRLLDDPCADQEEGTETSAPCA